MGDKPEKVAIIGKPKTYAERYAILYHVGTVPIRSNNLLSVYIPEHNYAKIAEIVNETKMSAAKVLAISSQPCECCRHSTIPIEIDGITYQIPRGLMTAKRSSTGVNIANRKRSGK